MALEVSQYHEPSVASVRYGSEATMPSASAITILNSPVLQVHYGRRCGHGTTVREVHDEFGALTEAIHGRNLSASTRFG